MEDQTPKLKPNKFIIKPSNNTNTHNILHKTEDVHNQSVIIRNNGSSIKESPKVNIVQNTSAYIDPVDQMNPQNMTLLSNTDQRD